MLTWRPRLPGEGLKPPKENYRLREPEEAHVDGTGYIVLKDGTGWHWGSPACLMRDCADLEDGKRKAEEHYEMANG